MSEKLNQMPCGEADIKEKIHIIGKNEKTIERDGKIVTLKENFKKIMDDEEERGDQVMVEVTNEGEATIEEVCQSLNIDLDDRKQKEVEEKWQPSGYIDWEVPGRPNFTLRIENRQIDGQGTKKIFLISYSGRKR
jgi:hypothetical protein